MHFWVDLVVGKQLSLQWFIAKRILTNNIGMGKQMDKMTKKRTQHIKLGMMRKEGTHKVIGEDMLNVQKNNDSIR
jgi:hypothetical protein